MVTSHDVARLAGVSQPTVSRALRDSPKVSELTKNRVREAARSLGYVPSSAGRALAMGRSHRIGLLLTDLENQFYPHVIAPMHDELEGLGYELMLITETSESAQIADRIVANQLDAVILATTTVDSVLPVRLRDRGIPFLYFNRTAETVRADAVTVDPAAGVDALVAELAELGHHRVGAIFGPRNTSTGEARESAIRARLDAADITLSEDRVLHGPFDFASGHRGTIQLLRGDQPPTAILCANDVVALGALNAAAELEVAVPGQVSVVGFDDLPESRWALVRLSTVAYDLDRMSREAAGLIVARLGADATDDFQQIAFPTRFVRRATLAASTD